MLLFQASVLDKIKILRLQGGAGSQTALPAADAVGPRMILFDILRQSRGAFADGRTGTWSKFEFRASFI
jgi:hypothetical protein